MYLISERAKQKIYSGGAEYRLFLTIGDERTPISWKNVSQVVISDSIIDNKSDVMYLGSFISKQIEIQLRNYENYDLTQKLYLEIGILLDDEYEVIPIGEFNIETSPEDFYKSTKIVALDNGVLFKPNVDISQFFDLTVGTDNNGKEIKGATLENLLKRIGDYFGVEVVINSECNKNVIVTQYDNTISGKQFMSWGAELMGCNVKAGRDGKIYLVPLKRAATDEIQAKKCKSFSVDKKYKIGKVRYDNGVTIPAEFGDDEENNTLNIRNGNLFITGDDTVRSTIIENIYNEVVGFEAYSLSAENYGDISHDSFDLVKYIKDDEEFITFYSGTITYKMSMMGKINVTFPTKQVEKTTNVIKDDPNEKIRSIRTEIDEVNNELRTTVTETIPNLKDTVDNNYTTIRDSLNNYAPNTSLEQITNQVNQIVGNSYTKTEVNQIVNGVGVDGVKVTYVITEMGIFDNKGLTIDRTGSPTMGRFSEKGLEVITKLSDGSEGDTVLEAVYNEKTKQSEVNAMNLRAKNFLMIDSISRFQNYMDSNQIKTGCFWTGFQEKVYAFTEENDEYYFVYNRKNLTFTSNNAYIEGTTAQTIITFTKDVGVLEVTFDASFAKNNTLSYRYRPAYTSTPGGGWTSGRTIKEAGVYNWTLDNVKAGNQIIFQYRHTTSELVGRDNVIVTFSRY